MCCPPSALTRPGVSCRAPNLPELVAVKRRPHKSYRFWLRQGCPGQDVDIMRHPGISRARNHSGEPRACRERAGTRAACRETQKQSTAFVEHLRDGAPTNRAKGMVDLQTGGRWACWSMRCSRGAWRAILCVWECNTGPARYDPTPLRKVSAVLRRQPFWRVPEGSRRTI